MRRAVTISNKIRARDDHPDGRARWLSLDARVIHAAADIRNLDWRTHCTRERGAIVRLLAVGPWRPPRDDHHLEKAAPAASTPCASRCRSPAVTAAGSW